MSQMGKFTPGGVNDPIETITGNSGGPVGPNLSGNLDFVGDGTTIDVVGSPGTNTLTISATSAVPVQFDTDSGSATPALGILDVLGGTNMNTGGATNVVTINLDDDVTLAGFLTTIDGDVTVGNQALNTTGPHVDFRKDQGGAVIVSGDDLGTITFTGYDGTDYITGASITSRSSGTVATNRVAGNLRFFTSPNSTTSEQERMVIAPTGAVSIASPDSGTGLTISGGGLNATGTITFPSLTSGVLEVNGSGVTSAVTLTQYALPVGGASGAIQSLADGAGSASEVLSSLGAGAEPVWASIASLGGIDGIIPDSGTSPVVPDGSGDVTFTGGTLITTTGGTNEITFDLDNGTDGQLIIGSTAGSPSYASLASADSSIVYTPGSNTLDLSVDVAAAGGVETLTGDSGGAISPTAGGDIGITGGTNINTAGAANAITVNLDDAITLATSVSSPLYTVASGDLVLNMTDDVGANAVSFTNNSDTEVAYIDSLGAASFATNLNIDNLNLSSNTISSSDTNGNITLDPDGAGVVTITYVNQYELLIGGSGGEVANLADGVGASGTYLQSNGAGMEPTWETVSGGGGITWNEETGTSATMAVDNGYIANNASLVTLTLPTTAAVGSVVRVAGKGAGGWAIAQNASEIIHFGTTDTTTGAGGSLASTETYDAVELVCVVADTEWAVISSVGNITIV